MQHCSMRALPFSPGCGSPTPGSSGHMCGAVAMHMSGDVCPMPPTEVSLCSASLMPGCTMSQQLYSTHACIASPSCRDKVVWILPATCADAWRSAIGFIVASAIVLPWTLTFLIGEALYLFRSLLACRTVVAIELLYCKAL